VNAQDAANVTVGACRGAARNLASTSRDPRRVGCELGMVCNTTEQNYVLVVLPKTCVRVGAVAEINTDQLLPVVWDKFGSRSRPSGVI
jgi:hypothetical protein